MHTWTWHERDGLSYLTCSLLDEWPHGFFTQQCWPQLPAELVRAIAPNTEAYRVKQVHGNRVLSTQEILTHYADVEANVPAEEAPMPEADGVITDHPDHAVWVATADCVPALIADSKTGQVAAVHAGWRGTAQKIVPVTLQRFLEGGSSLEDIRVALGPAIAGSVYQVSTTVAAEVGSTILPEAGVPAAGSESESADPMEEQIEAVLTALKALPDAPVLDDPQAGRARLDVRRVNVLQLEQTGLSPEQIAVAPYCTYQDGDRFFSYRRSRLKKVQWSGIARID